MLTIHQTESNEKLSCKADESLDLMQGRSTDFSPCMPAAKRGYGVCEEFKIIYVCFCEGGLGIEISIFLRSR